MDIIGYTYMNAKRPSFLLVELSINFIFELILGSIYKLRKEIGMHPSGWRGGSENGNCP